MNEHPIYLDDSYVQQEVDTLHDLFSMTIDDEYNDSYDIPNIDFDEEQQK